MALAASAPAAAQEHGKQPAAPSDAPITVTTRIRHVSTVVLPASAEIVDVVVGDTEYWDVTAAAHMAFVRPLVEGARSNLVVLTAAGDVVPLLVVESSASTGPAAVDAIVRVVVAGGATGPADAGPGSRPVLAAADAVAAAAVRATEAWEAVAATEARAVERVEAARTSAQAALDAQRETYPRQLQFVYRWPVDASPAAFPWLVEGMWHDGQRTYLRTRATSPALYERVDGELRPVPVSTVLDDLVHVVPRVLGPGALEVGGRRLDWSVAAREVGP